MERLGRELPQGPAELPEAYGGSDNRTVPLLAGNRRTRGGQQRFATVNQYWAEVVHQPGLHRSLKAREGVT